VLAARSYGLRVIPLPSCGLSQSRTIELGSNPPLVSTARLRAFAPVTGGKPATDLLMERGSIVELAAHVAEMQDIPGDNWTQLTPSGTRATALLVLLAATTGAWLVPSDLGLGTLHGRGLGVLRAVEEPAPLVPAEA
jgi:hypothetical protein